MYITFVFYQHRCKARNVGLQNYLTKTCIREQIPRTCVPALKKSTGNGLDMLLGNQPSISLGYR